MTEIYYGIKITRSRVQSFSLLLAVVNNNYRTVANNSFADVAPLRFVSRCSGQPIALGLDVLGWSDHRNPSYFSRSHVRSLGSMWNVRKHNTLSVPKNQNFTIGEKRRAPVTCDLEIQ